MGVLNVMRYDSNEEIDDMVKSIIDQYIKSGKKEFVIVNIGTDKCIGDSLAPFVGSILKDKYPCAKNVEGTIENPIHALNVVTAIEQVRFKYDRPFVIGIDACLADEADVGEIHLRTGCIRPGRGVGKNLACVGDISIVGMVSDSGNSVPFTQRPIRLSFIIQMASKIATILANAASKIEECEYNVY